MYNSFTVFNSYIFHTKRDYSYGCAAIYLCCYDRRYSLIIISGIYNVYDNCKATSCLFV